MAGSPIILTTTVPVSLTSSGAAANGDSIVSDVSADGRYVLVGTLATNFWISDGNGLFDWYRKDLLTGAMQTVSEKGAYSGGLGTPPEAAISGDGRFVLFVSDSINLTPLDLNGSKDVFLRDMQTNAVTLVSSSSANVQGERDSYAPDISTDGRYAVFTSFSPNLVAGDTNGTYDIFRKDLLTGLTERVSASSTGVLGNARSENASVSADGRYVVFESFADNLVAGDTNGVLDVFRKDMLTGAIDLVSKSAFGVPGSANSYMASVSANGRYVAFVSQATNLVAGDTNGTTDVFVKDLTTGALVVASSSGDGVLGDQASLFPVISDNGRYVAFASNAGNLADGDGNGATDVFRKDVFSGDLILVSHNDAGAAGNASSYLPAISPDGSRITFTSDAVNLSTVDSLLARDIFEVAITEISTFSIETIDTLRAEGDSGSVSFKFQVSRTGPADAFASVKYSVVPLSADGADFAGGQLPNGTVSFFEGESVKTITISVAGDLSIEQNEQFAVSLSEPSAGTQIATGSATAMIRDDDNGLKVIGTPDADTLVGSAGSDHFDGGSGADTVSFPFTRNEAHVTKSGTTWLVDNSVAIDTLKSIEQLQFADKSFFLQNPPLGHAPDYGKDTSFLFDSVYYLLANPSKVPTVSLAGAAQDWYAVGAAQHLKPNAWFDASYYSAKWADLAPLHLDDATLFMHYNLYGVWEGRSAGPAFDHFDGNRYLTDWPDVAAYVDANLPAFLGSRTNGAIAHFIIYGANEQRTAYDTDGTLIDMGYTL
ncbi:MAG: hypothetical protein U1E86_21605 [Burkholderiaceae bacterium]